MEREQLLNDLTTLDFMAVDMALYLDTHPNDEDGIAIYNEIIKEANNARALFEEKFGPLCSYRSMSNDKKFEWINNPWPWQECFNYSVKGDIC